MKQKKAFAKGERVCLSALGVERCIIGNRRSGGITTGPQHGRDHDRVTVRWDHLHDRETYHVSFIERPKQADVL